MNEKEKKSNINENPTLKIRLKFEQKIVLLEKEKLYRDFNIYKR